MHLQDNLFCLFVFVLWHLADHGTPFCLPKHMCAVRRPRFLKLFPHLALSCEKLAYQFLNARKFLSNLQCTCSRRHVPLVGWRHIYTWVRFIPQGVMLEVEVFTSSVSPFWRDEAVHHELEVCNEIWTHNLKGTTWEGGVTNWAIGFLHNSLSPTICRYHIFSGHNWPMLSAVHFDKWYWNETAKSKSSQYHRWILILIALND